MGRQYRRLNRSRREAALMPTDLTLPYGLCFYGTLALLFALCLVVLIARRYNP